MNNISKEKTGHINYRSPYETSDTCGTCDGANCDVCKDIWFVEGVEDVFFTFEEAKKASAEAQSLISYDGANFTSPSAFTVKDGLLYAYIFIYGAPEEESRGYVWVPCNEKSSLCASKMEETLKLMEEFDRCPITAKHSPSYANSCDVSMTCTKTCHHGCSKISFIAEPAADAELSVYEEEENKMKNAINEITRTLSPKGYNHACEDFAVFTYAPGDVFAICVEARTCTSCWQVGHDEEHVYAEVGERIKVSSLLSDPDLDELDSEAELTVDVELTTVEREYLDAKERLERRGINPDEVKYFTHSTEPTGMGPIYKFIVRSFMSPMTLREENKKLLSALVEQKKNLSDFRDADIVEVFETYSFDTAIDIMDTLTDLGYMRASELFGDYDFEEEGGR